MDINPNTTLVGFNLKTESFDGKDEVLASVSINEKYLNRPDVLAGAITRLIQEVQLKKNLPLDKRIKVSSETFQAGNQSNLN